MDTATGFVKDHVSGTVCVTMLHALYLAKLAITVKYATSMQLITGGISKLIKLEDLAKPYFLSVVIIA